MKLSDQTPPANTALIDAPAEIQLAVDLIYLLETNDIAPNIGLKALEIVKSDLVRKLAQLEQK